MPSGIYKHKSPSEETKEKIRKSNIGLKRSEEFRKKMKIAATGRKHCEETKRKIGLANKGKKRSEESKIRYRLANRKDKHPNWQGGISFEPYTTDWTETLRRSIRERDKYTCGICGLEPAIHVHHIDYDKTNCNPENLITLCRPCHIKTNYNRKYWMNYLLNKKHY